MKKSRAYCFTYNNPSGSAEQFRKCLESVGVKEYVFQEEMGSCLHWQGVLRFENPRGIKWQDLLPKGIHWERCRNWRNSVKYCSKLDTRVRGPWTNIKGLKYRKSVVDPLEGKDLYMWQRDAKSLVSGPQGAPSGWGDRICVPDDRKIYWFWDEKGCSGKSALCKHLKLKFGKSVMTCAGKTGDINYAVAERLNSGHDIEILLIDIPRSNIDYVNYGAIEKIKDGYVFSGKYESCEVVFNSPHVLVFANSPPHVHNMSLDRWVIKEIEI